MFTYFMLQESVMCYSFLLSTEINICLINMPLLNLGKDECLDYCSISNENITMTVPLQVFLSSVNQRT